MVHILVRKVKATNMFFSYWVLVLLAIGLIIEEWAELKLGPQKPMIKPKSMDMLHFTVAIRSKLLYGKR